jgi:hypothetical protein
MLESHPTRSRWDPFGGVFKKNTAPTHPTLASIYFGQDNGQLDSISVKLFLHVSVAR